MCGNDPAAVEYAEKKAIILTIENHYKDGYWEYPEFALKSEVFLEIIDQIDLPYFGINFDPSNTIVAGEDPIELLQKIKSRVVTMHASDRYLNGGNVADLRKHGDRSGLRLRRDDPARRHRQGVERLRCDLSHPQRRRVRRVDFYRRWDEWDGRAAPIGRIPESQNQPILRSIDFTRSCF